MSSGPRQWTLINGRPSITRVCIPPLRPRPANTFDLDRHRIPFDMVDIDQTFGSCHQTCSKEKGPNVEGWNHRVKEEPIESSEGGGGSKAVVNGGSKEGRLANGTENPDDLDLES